MIQKYLQINHHSVEIRVTRGIKLFEKLIITSIERFRRTLNCTFIYVAVDNGGVDGSVFDLDAFSSLLFPPFHFILFWYFHTASRDSFFFFFNFLVFTCYQLYEVYTRGKEKEKKDRAPVGMKKTDYRQ